MSYYFGEIIQLTNLIGLFWFLLIFYIIIVTFKCKRNKESSELVVGK